MPKIHDGPPTLRWEPIKLLADKPLQAEGALQGSPFPTRDAALVAVEKERAKAGQGDHLFLVTLTANGWAAFEYDERRLGKIDFNELRVSDLPLGGNALVPNTYVVDARGKLAALTPKSSGGFQLVDTKIRDDFAPGKLEKPKNELWLPAVEARPQVNHGRNVHWEPRFAFRPGADIEELSAIMRWVQQKLPPGTKVKAGGSRHSWSPVAATSDVYIHPELMKFIEKPSELKAGLAPKLVENLVRVGAGTTVKELNDQLWKNGKGLPAMGGYDGQTLGGVLPTGTHGSVLSSGPLADIIQSVDLVRADGTKVRIEPGNGITDAAEFKKTHPGWVLEQNDQVFDAARINLGTMGVVHSYTLKVKDRFYLNEIRTKTTGAKAAEIFANENIYNLMSNTSGPNGAERTGLGPPKAFSGHPQKAYHLEMLWNPHTDNAIVTTRTAIEGAAAEKIANNEPHYLKDPPTRSLFRALIMDDKHSRPHFGEFMSENFGDLIGEATEAVSQFVPKLIPKWVDLAMNSTIDKQYQQRSYNVFKIGDGPSHLPAQAGTLSVPIKGDAYLRAMELMREVADDFADEHGQYHTGPISLRFVKGSTALLGEPEDVCKFEVILGGDDQRTRELTQKLMWAYYQALQNEFGADVRLHFGHHIPKEFETVAKKDLAASFPGAKKFAEIRNRFDPDGRFLNPWQEKLLPDAP